MSRAGVRCLLNYYKNNLEYKRKDKQIEYKNWTIAMNNNMYIVIFDGSKYWWDVVFTKENIVCALCNRYNVMVPDLVKDLLKMDLVNIHKNMFKLANLNVKDSW